MLGKGCAGLGSLLLWGIFSCSENEYGQKQEQEKRITSYNRKWQSGNCETTVFGTNCKTITICHILPYPEEEKPIGIWGQWHKRYLKKHRKATYTTLLNSGKLNTYLPDIDEQAQQRFERLIEQMKQAQGITEQLKTENALE